MDSFLRGKQEPHRLVGGAGDDLPDALVRRGAAEFVGDAGRAERLEGPALEGPLGGVVGAGVLHLVVGEAGLDGGHPRGGKARK